MRKFLTLFIIVIAIFSLQNAQKVEAASITVFPEKIIQGEPLEIIIGDETSISNIKSLLFEDKPVPFFVFNNKIIAFYGVDLAKKPGAYKILLTLTDNTKVEKTVTISARKKIEAPLGIPEKLGGNTPVAQKSLVTGLANENDILSKLISNKRALWTEKFIFPLDKHDVVDDYGYTRQTGQYFIAHKGTDFHADEGTIVKTMNRGVVRLVKKFKEYGSTVIVDHGMGLMTFYMHLSKISVKEGYVVERGQEIGKSGQTGYALSPHLHLTVRINNTSIDPMKFMEIF